MNGIKNMIKRVRWIPVLSALLVLLIIAVLLISIPSKYSTKGRLALSVSVKPSRITKGERATISIEVKNTDKNMEKTINIDAKTFDDKFLFTDTGDKTTSRYDILIGPRETRKIKFDVMPTAAALPGEYRVEVKAREKLLPDGPKDSVLIKLLE